MKGSNVIPGFIVLIVLCYYKEVNGAKLSRYISEFDVLSYDTQHVIHQHRRAIRSPHSHHVELKLNAFGSNLHLRLKKDNDVLAPNFVIQTTAGQHTDGLDDIHFYKGDVVDIPNSFCHGSLKDGVFQGRIITKDDKFSVEPASNYFVNQSQFHSVIYKDRHVDFPKYTSGSCGMKDGVRERMDKKLGRTEETYKQADVEAMQRRKKRQVPGAQTCKLHIVTDHTYYVRIGEDIYEVLRQMGEHVQAASGIFSNTDFDPYQNINFAIEKITVFTPKDIGKSSYPFSNIYLGVEKFLDLVGDIPGGQNYCLVYAFANRDFANGVLGLAWIANPSDKSGGMCASSYNAGIVTTNNYGADVPPVVSHLTLTHEMGHNFGSRHDPDNQPTCVPNTNKGNYLMFAHASAGDLQNNNEFSSCSIVNISAVLDNLGAGPRFRRNCLVDRDSVSLCGNNIIEPGEECDCGFDNGCTDDCCVAQNSTKNDPRACKLRSGSVCSPQQGPCCTATCQFKDANEQCSADSECHMSANCTGDSAMCSFPNPKEDGIFCDNRRKICDAGACNKSRCLEIGSNRIPCQCDNEKQRCHLCCADVDQLDICISYQQISDMGEELFLDTGAPCEDYMGYCDVFNECRLAQEDGPLANIIRGIFHGEQQQLTELLSDWVMNYWWILVIGFIFLIGVMALLMFLCNIMIPSDNPWKEQPVNRRASRVVKLREQRARGSQYHSSQQAAEKAKTTQF